MPSVIARVFPSIKGKRSRTYLLFIARNGDEYFRRG